MIIIPPPLPAPAESEEEELLCSSSAAECWLIIICLGRGWVEGAPPYAPALDCMC